MSDTKQENQVAVVQPKARASHILAAFVGMEPAALLETIRAQCFKGDPSRITDAQLAAFVSIAVEMKVNPLLPGMLYAFPGAGNSITPMMGPDGVFKKLAEHPDIDSWETTIYPEDITLAPLYATTKIWRKQSERPLSYTAVFSEWRINANPNWNSRPRHMLGLRSLKQAARQIIHGIPFDEDERVIMAALDVTPAGAVPSEKARAEPKARSPKGAAKAEAGKEVIGEVVPELPTEQEMAEGAYPVTPVTPEKEKPLVRVGLQDGEEVTLTVMVKGVKTLMANIVQSDGTKKPTPSVIADVGGEYEGNIYAFGGAVQENEALVPLPLWNIGNTNKVKLVGRLNKAVGVVQSRVLEASAATPAGETDEF